MAKLTALPLDLTGKLSSNLIPSEVRTLTKVTGKSNRVLVTKFGAFYADSLVVRTDTGKLLTRDKDYVITYYYEDLMTLTAKEVAAIIVVTNAALGNGLRLSYQAVGGPYALNLDEIKDLLLTLENPKDKINWKEIIDKPLMFNPADHMHEYWQLYGLESTQINLKLLGEAWKYGTKPVLDANRGVYDSLKDQVEDAAQVYFDKVMAHIRDYNNPHKTDMIQLGLQYLINMRLANAAESASKTITNLYQPIGGIYNQLTSYALPVLNSHKANRNNPHKVSIDDPLIDTYNYATTVALFNNKLRTGEIAPVTKALEGRSMASIYATTRTHLEYDNLDPTIVFTMDQIAPPKTSWAPRNNPTDYILLNKTYMYLGTLFGEYTKSGRSRIATMSMMAPAVSSNTDGMSGTSLSQFTDGETTKFEVYHTEDGNTVQLL